MDKPNIGVIKVLINEIELYQTALKMITSGDPDISIKIKKDKNSTFTTNLPIDTELTITDDQLIKSIIEYLQRCIKGDKERIKDYA